MSKERDTLVVGSGEATTTAEMKEESRSERKARLVKILERGVVADRLRVELPPGIYGEWVVDDSVEITRMKLLGFRLDKEYAVKHSLHSSGVEEGKIGDVVHMICDQETHDILEEIRKEQYASRHLRRSKSKQQGEESEATSNMERIGLPPIIESSDKRVTKTEIEDMLTTKTVIK